MLPIYFGASCLCVTPFADVNNQVHTQHRAQSSVLTVDSMSEAAVQDSSGILA